MLRFLRKYVFANAGLKILALGISFLLWATYTSDPVAEVGFQVPLEFTSMPSHLEITGDIPTNVRVRVRGRSALLRRMIPSDLSLRLDMKDAEVGTTAVRITSDMIGAPFGATVVDVSPSEIRVTFVPRQPAPAPKT
ncbi:MAG: CdaR family protein [Candidatus Acidiferrales bacterium]